MRLAPTLTALLLALPPAVFAQVPTAAPDWVKQLGSTHYETRERASLQLLRAGPSVLPLLRPAATHPDPEVRRRVRDLITELEKRADNERVLTPRTVRVQATDKPLREVLEDLSRQSRGGTVMVRDDSADLGDKKVTLDTGDVPFWDALGQICEKAGVHEVPPEQNMGDPVQRMGRGGRLYLDGSELRRRSSSYPIVLVSGAPRDPSQVVGPLRFRVVDERTAAEGERGQFVALEVDLRPDPGLDWEETVRVRIDRAVSAVGREWKPEKEFIGEPFWLEDPGEAKAVFTTSGSIPRGLGTRTFRFRLDRGRDEARGIRELHGSVAAWVRLPAEDVVKVPDVAKALKQPVLGRDGSRLIVSAWQQEEDGLYTLRVEAREPHKGPALPQLPTATVSAWRRRWLSPEPPPDEVPPFRVAGDKVEVKVVTSKTLQYDDDAGTRITEMVLALPVGYEGPVSLAYEGRRTVLLETKFCLRDIPVPAKP